MDKFSYGSYDPSNAAIAFSSANGYADPSSELETRKMLSMPLKEVKDYINATVPEDSEGNAVKLVISENGVLQFLEEEGDTPTDISPGASDTETIASGDSLVFYDSSDSKLAKSSATFGADDHTFLRKDGTFNLPVITENVVFNISGTTFSIVLDS